MRSEKPERHVRKASHCGSKQQQSSCVAITQLLLVRATYINYIVVLRPHPVRGESHIQRNAIGEVATTSPRLYNESHGSHVLCVKAELGMTFTSWSQHHFAAIGKARAACAQSFTMWHQATIEFMRRNHSRDHSIIACSCHVQHIYCCSSRTSRSW